MKLITSIHLIFLALIPSVLCKNFTIQHPGLGFSETYLNYLRDNHEVSGTHASSLYKLLTDDVRSSYNYGMHGPCPIVERNPGTTCNNEWEQDMMAIFLLAVRAYIEDDVRYANRAMDIFYIWATNNTQFTGIEAVFEIGGNPWGFTGGDILNKYYVNGNTTYLETVNKYVTNLLWPTVQIYADGTSNFWFGNQGALMLSAALHMAVYLDDHEKFINAVNAYYTDTNTGVNMQTEQGYVGDITRDQGHAFEEIKDYAFCAEILWSQGIDAYSVNNNALYNITELHSYYNLNNSVTLEYGWGNNPYSEHISSAARNSPHNRYPWDIFYNHYVTRKGWTLPYTEKLASLASENIPTAIFNKTVDNSTASYGVKYWTEPTLKTNAKPKLNKYTVGSSTSSIQSYDNGTYVITSRTPIQGTTTFDTTDYTVYYNPFGTDDFVYQARLVSLTNGYAGIRSAAQSDYKFYQKVNYGEGGSVNAYWGKGYGAKPNYATKPWVNFYGFSLPYYFKITKRASKFAVYFSTDGEHWICQGSTYYSSYNVASTGFYVGLYAQSKSGDADTVAVFDNVYFGQSKATVGLGDFEIYELDPVSDVVTSNGTDTIGTDDSTTNNGTDTIGTDDSATNNGTKSNSGTNDALSLKYSPSLMLTAVVLSCSVLIHLI